MREWWRDMRTRCSPLSVREPIEPAEVRARIAKALAWIAPQERLRLPDRFDEYLSVLDSTTWYGHHVALDFILSAPHAIAQHAEGDTPERHDDHEIARAAGLWISLGTVRDKHEYFLCCDRQRDWCGRVADAHDDHPYLNGTGMLADLGDFDDWLDDVATYRYQRDAGTLIALTPEERVELDPVLSRGDAWELIVAARDLEYALTPDEAWAHANGAPDRVVRLTKPPPQIRELAIARDADSCVALLPRSKLAAMPVPRFSAGVWDARRKFQFQDTANAALPGIGDVLYVGPV